MDTSKDSSTVQDLIDVNDLQMTLASDLSVVQQRRSTRQFFVNQTYSSSNRQASCVFQTGSSFIGETTVIYISI